ncbi:MAG: HU family DNA-binding protein [Pelovirga sp.]
MTKADLVNAMAEKAGLSKTDAEEALKAFIETVTGALKSGDKVALVGFGTFSVGERAARTGQNPQTGQKIQIPAAKSPKFKAGKALKDAVN